MVENILVPHRNSLFAYTASALQLFGSFYPSKNCRGRSRPDKLRVNGESAPRPGVRKLEITDQIGCIVCVSGVHLPRWRSVLCKRDMQGKRISRATSVMVGIHRSSSRCSLPLAPLSAMTNLWLCRSEKEPPAAGERAEAASHFPFPDCLAQSSDQQPLPPPPTACSAPSRKTYPKRIPCPSDD